MNRSSHSVDCARQRHGRRWRLIQVSGRLWAILVSLSGSVLAQDADPAGPLVVDEQTAAALEPPTDELPELAGRIISDMRDAEARLAAGRLDAATGELQERINTDLEALLAALEQQASQPSPVAGESPEEQTQGTDSSSSGGTGDSGGQSGDGATEGESAEGDRAGELTDAELERRRNLATSVWGHLPERERDEMLGAFSERFLPAYDELVRRYYEALARQRAEER